MERITAAVGQQLQHRAGEKLRVEAVVFSNTFGLLGKTAGADSLLRRHRKET
jgi:cobalt-precorrin-5B (C1)-methyltransferase